jgi:hypothetical protein
MKKKESATSFLVPLTLGRSEGDMTKRNRTAELELFRETLTRPAKVQVLAMLGLSDPTRLDRPQETKISDIAKAMGYEPYKRPEGQKAFQPWQYRAIEDTGLKLRRKPFEVFIREPTGNARKGKRNYDARLVELSILQEFGFVYEDKGRPINLDTIPKDKLIDCGVDSGTPLYAIPITDGKGHFINNRDGTIRRRLANGVTWTFASRFARLAQDRKTAWVFYREAVNILRKYIKKPASFDLMWMTLFHIKAPIFEMNYSALVRHMNIRSKDRSQIRAAIKAAFQDAFNEGIIAERVKTRPSLNHKPKEGKPQREERVFQWQRGAKWETGNRLIEVQSNGRSRAKTEG